MTLNGHFLAILNPLNTTPEIAEERIVNDFLRSKLTYPHHHHG